MFCEVNVLKKSEVIFVLSFENEMYSFFRVMVVKSRIEAIRDHLWASTQRPQSDHSDFMDEASITLLREEAHLLKYSKLTTKGSLII